jgi:4-diphosphocytidyl-2-C-methyl-D-erythritol kinase
MGKDGKVREKTERYGGENMRLRAFAKINLGLDVIRRREDGYHEVRMIMQTIQMYDHLDMQIADKPGITLTTNLNYIPVNENNLVHKAAKLLIEKYRIKQGVSIELNKFIPVAAGMAGGSSDAAATLVGMNKLFHLKLSTRELMELGVNIGADVPYCVLRGTALAEGIGEKLTPLAPMPECYVLIGKPGISVSTKFVYTNLKIDRSTHHPDIAGMIKSLEEGNLYGVTQRMENVLESVTIPAYPVIEDIKDHMKAHGALNAIMSGSGPTVFGIFDDKEKAEAACKALRESMLTRQTFLTTVFNNGGTLDDK